jgi:hypothetical protein
MALNGEIGGGDGARERSGFALGANGLGTLADSGRAEGSREQKRAIIARETRQAGTTVSAARVMA